MNNKKQYDVFIDLAKIIACLLVVGGHLYQSLAQAGIVDLNDTYYKTNQILYYFHVQIFFVCSGYLYQKNTVVDSVDSWLKNAKKKIISLGIPYVFFTAVSWILKAVFSNEVNQQNKGSLFEVLVLDPMSPYWYLITIIVIFILVPTINKKSNVYSYMAIDIILIIVQNALVRNGIVLNITIAKAITYALYFIVGMIIAYADAYKIFGKIKSCSMPIILLIIWLVFGVIMRDVQIIGIWPIYVIWGLVTVLLIIWWCFNITKKITPETNEKIRTIGKYVYPVFLMHTLIAAPVRIIISKLGVDNWMIYAIVGMLANVMGPIIVYELMKKLKWPLFVLYPGKIKNV